jgi:uncharacterized protein DUF4192
MTSLTLRSPADVLAAVPYLLGFHPTNSVVLIGLRGKRVIFQARTDAPVPHEIDSVAAYLAAVSARQSPTSAIIIGYGPEHPIERALSALRAAVEVTGVRVADVLRVHEDRYWSLTCADPSCCPPDGSPVDSAGTAVAAAMTYEGMVALPDREALSDALSAAPGAGIEPELARARERLDQAQAGGARRRRAVARIAVRDALERYASGGRLDDDEVAWLAVLLTDTRVRDEAWQRMLGVEPRDEHESLWRDLVRRLPDWYAPAPATLLALAAWRAGDGTTASIAAERALAADPGYTLAGLVLQALRAAIPPSAMEPLLDRPPRRRRPRVRAGAAKAAPP